jgi:hypothetical protein
MSLDAINFWKDARRSQVKWHPADPRLIALIAESHFPGLYALVYGDRVIKVGEAQDVGARLKKHAGDGCWPVGSSYPGEFPAWWECSGELVRRELTICTLRYDVQTPSPREARRRRRHDVEQPAIQQARGGVLWEQMRGRERREQPVIPGTKRPKRLVEPGAVRRRVLAELGPIRSATKAK